MLNGTGCIFDGGVEYRGSTVRSATSRGMPS
jgi:hypothetical protein